jgi:hypothetical protein
MADRLARVAGILLLVPFALTVYIGLDDKNLYNYQITHWYINWVFAAAFLVAAILLLAFPRRISLVALGGVAWPILYAIALVVDVETKLCIGGIQANCWPSKSAAFQYLILNNPNVAGGYGWLLWTGTMPTILAFTALAFILSLISIFMLHKRSAKSKTMPSPTVSPSGSSTIPP